MYPLVKIIEIFGNILCVNCKGRQHGDKKEMRSEIKFSTKKSSFSKDQPAEGEFTGLFYMTDLLLTP